MTDLFDIRIAREAEPIPLERWVEVIERDPEFEIVHTLEGRSPRTMELFDVPAPYTARWTAHPEAIPFILEYRNGAIESTWVDRHVLTKAKALAARLDAQVTQSVD
jgi:hypothetical protein